MADENEVVKKTSDGKGLLIVLLVIVFSLSLNAAVETSSSLTKQKMEVLELKNELNNFYSEKEKCLMLGLLIGRVAEAVKQRHKKDHSFQHLTLLEEAHRLLSKPQGGEDSSKRLGVELFANLLAEVLLTLKEVIKSKNFGRNLQEKYEGSLISRLDNLTTGAKGRMLNTRNSIDINEMLDKKVVIELEDLRDEQDKCIMIS